MSHHYSKPLRYMENVVEELDAAIRRKSLRRIKSGIEKLEMSSDWVKSLLPEGTANLVFKDFDRHLYYMKRFYDKKDIEWIRSNFDDIKKRDLRHISSGILSLREEKKGTERTTPLSKEVFIVHGHDKQPVEELKAILEEIGLSPIVLHEQPSGSRAMLEKLERYSDVGYAIVILTPDDLGALGSDFESLSTRIASIFKPLSDDLMLPMEKELQEIKKIPAQLDDFMEETRRIMKYRARQNVVLEFGYFIGRLGRDRVCCLLKGDVETPSDMRGIVYVPFKEKAIECRERIIKELKAAGYEI